MYSITAVPMPMTQSSLMALAITRLAPTLLAEDPTHLNDLLLMVI